MAEGRIETIVTELRLDTGRPATYDSRTRMSPTDLVRRAVNARAELCTAGLALLLLLVLLIPKGGSAI
jgi:hypothetical protein